MGSDGLERNVSRCGETQLGWYRNEPGTAWGCFYGKKLEPVPEDWIGRWVSSGTALEFSGQEEDQREGLEAGTDQWTPETSV